MPTITQKNKDLLTADNGDFICPKCHIDRTGGAHEGKAKKSKEKQGELDQQIAEELTHDVAADSIQSDEVEAISDRDTEQKDSFQT